MELEFFVNECSVGLLGSLVDRYDINWDNGVSTKDTNWYDCTTRRYTPEMPIKEWAVFDRQDKVYDYLPWGCNDYTQLEPVADETQGGQETISIEEDHGFGEVDESAWEWNPEN